MRRLVSALLLLAGVVVSPAVAQTAAQPGVRWEPYVLRGPGETRLSAELGRLTVPERHAAPAGRTLEIAFVRLRAHGTATAPPLVYLDGGPGGNGYGTAQIPGFHALFERVRATRDVVLLSQRGTGLSVPALTCGRPTALSDDLFTTRAKMAADLEPGLRACAEKWRAQGVDLEAFNTEESADDVDAVRRALGADRIGLLGFSYGTHLAIAVLRKHSAHVDRAVLAGVEGPGHTWKLPVSLDEQLARLGAAAGVDLRAALRLALDRLEKTPLQVPITIAGVSRAARLGADGLRYLLRRDIGDTNDWPWIPAAITELARGEHATIAPVLARRAMQIGSGGSLMGMLMDCASAASPDRLGRIKAEEPRSLLGPMTNFPFPEVCDALGVKPLGEAFRRPVTSSVPTLFISGTYDSNTPPAQAHEVSRGFTRATLLTVDQAGHESTLPDEGVRAQVLAFLAGNATSVSEVKVARPEFRVFTRP